MRAVLHLRLMHTKWQVWALSLRAGQQVLVRCAHGRS